MSLRKKTYLKINSLLTIVPYSLYHVPLYYGPHLVKQYNWHNQLLTLALYMKARMDLRNKTKAQLGKHWIEARPYCTSSKKNQFRTDRVSVEQSRHKILVPNLLPVTPLSIFGAPSEKIPT
jgi:hypothetical protein